MAADSLKNDPFERDVEQAITALKKGTNLLKYRRRGKPKFCPFKLSSDENTLIWYSGKKEKRLSLKQVSRIIPGQRTAVFLRRPRPDKEYQSFSLIYGQRSLDLICKDKEESEAWFIGLKTLIPRQNFKRWIIGSKNDKASNSTRGDSPLASSYSSTIGDKELGSIQQCSTIYDAPAFAILEDMFYDVKCKPTTGSVSISKSLSSGSADTSNGGVSGVDNNVRVSYSSAVSSSSYGSGDDFDSLGDVLIWGKGFDDSMIAYASDLSGNLHGSRIDTSSPKALESTVLLDIHSIACGSKHSVLVTKQGETYSWGEESGGRLEHGVDADVTHPKLISTLSGINIESIACGEFHTCAISFCGDLYTWGDGMHNSGLLDHGNDTAHWIPKKVCGPFERLQISSVSCGPYHRAVVTSTGQLFTFGDGTFGALGHGDRESTNVAREVKSLRGMHTVGVACGAWHTVAIVEVVDSLNYGSSSKLFTWGDGDKGKLGHADRQTRLVPSYVSSLFEPSFCQVACGYDITVALSTSGQVYTMSSNAFGQLGNPTANGWPYTLVEGGISSSFVEEIACGSHHVAALTSKSEVYTWGRGANGRLGHGDNFDRNTPTLVEALKDTQVKSVVCGTDFTAIVCLKSTSGLDQSICSSCRLQFGFRRKRHNCYNCGLVFCKACSSRKSMKASLAPDCFKPYQQGAALEFYKGMEKKAYLYLHCWLILKDAPKWTNRFTGNAVRTGMPPRSSQDSASPIDLDADLEAIERPEHGQKEAKRRAKKSKNCLGNEDDAFAAAFGELAQKKKEFDDRKLVVLQEAELKREERFERAFAQEQERIALEKRRDDERIAIEKRRDDERIMAIDLNSLAAPQKEFYMALQMEILARVRRG